MGDSLFKMDVREREGQKRKQLHSVEKGARVPARASSASSGKEDQLEESAGRSGEGSRWPDEATGGGTDGGTDEITIGTHVTRGSPGERAREWAAAVQHAADFPRDACAHQSALNLARDRYVRAALPPAADRHAWIAHRKRYGTKFRRYVHTCFGFIVT